MKLPLSLTVNGAPIAVEVEPRTSLADLLRDELGLTATHLGCEHGVCGACTILIDGAPARACIALAITLEGAEVRTLEGLADDAAMRTIKAAFHHELGLQCGYCTPGMLMTAAELLSRGKPMSRDDIRAFLSGNYCRCTGYHAIIDAVETTLKARAG
jgi:carbon-monoxide dehydrogenase small subunit